jgi:hypothetical protein
MQPIVHPAILAEASPIDSHWSRTLKQGPAAIFGILMIMVGVFLARSSVRAPHGGKRTRVPTKPSTREEDELSTWSDDNYACSAMQECRHKRTSSSDISGHNTQVMCVVVDDDTYRL